MKYRIRKLTAKECWRLQGIKDEWFEKAAQEKQYPTLCKIFGGKTECNVKQKDAHEKQIQNDSGIFVSCIREDSLEMVVTSPELRRFLNKQENEKLQNVNIVIEPLGKLERSGCVINISKCIDFTEIPCIMTEEKDQLHTVIIEQAEKGKQNIEKYMKIRSEENFSKQKLFIILILLKQIIESKIFTSTLQTANIQLRMQSYEDLKNNMAKIVISNFEMESISMLTSPSRLYKIAGNGECAEVVKAIFRQLIEVSNND